MSYQRKYLPYICLFLHAAMSFLSMGCRKLTQTDPASDLLTVSRVFSSDATAEEAMNAYYISALFASRSFMNGGISLDAGLSADELDCKIKPIPPEDSFRRNELMANSILSNNLFGGAYSLIYQLNSMLEGIAKSMGMSAAVRSELKGEAEFNRAFLYFYLVNLYGPVPLVLGTDFLQNERLPRAAADSIYAQIVSDLEDAQQSLPADYIDAAGYAGDRTRPNQAAATALLARICLYLGHWASADSAASVVIANARYQMESNLDDVFLSGSREAIWQLQSVHGAEADSMVYLFMMGRPGPAFVFTADLLGDFETGDLRRQHWTKSSIYGGVTYSYPYKYKSLNGGATQYETVLRLAEQYLVRAEARVQEGNLAGAMADLNTIRSRAGLANTTATTTAAVMAAVLQERRIELMTEWGHRWLDLKRTGQADAVLSAEKSGWNPYDALYPIPTTVIQQSPGMQQNPGY